MEVFNVNEIFLYISISPAFFTFQCYVDLLTSYCH